MFNETRKKVLCVYFIVLIAAILVSLILDYIAESDIEKYRGGRLSYTTQLI